MNKNEETIAIVVFVGDLKIRISTVYIFIYFMQMDALQYKLLFLCVCVFV